MSASAPVSPRRRRRPPAPPPAALPPLLDVYDAALTAAPLVTKAATSAVLFALGETVQQALRRPRSASPLDSGRIARFALVGGVVHGPLFAAFFPALDAAVDPVAASAAAALGSAGPSPGALAAALKVLIDQAAFTPFLWLPLFFGSTAALEAAAGIPDPLDAVGRGAADGGGGAASSGWTRAAREARDKGWGLTPTLRANWLYWVPANVINYGLIDPSYRVLYVNGAALLWTAYLSGVQRGGRHRPL